MSEDAPVANRPKFALGSIVRHRDFGRGRIAAYDRDRYVILFSGGDAKSVAFDFTGLETDAPAGDPELSRITQAVREVLGDHGWLDEGRSDRDVIEEADRYP